MYRSIHADCRNAREMTPDTIFGKVWLQKLEKTPVRATFGRKWHRMTARIMRITIGQYNQLNSWVVVRTV